MGLKYPGLVWHGLACDPGSTQACRYQTFNLAILDNFEHSFGLSHDPGSQAAQAKPYQTKPRHFRPIFRPFWPIFWPKVPKSKWIWFGDTYPLNQGGVLSAKILVPPFEQFKKHHFGSADMCVIYTCTMVPIFISHPATPTQNREGS